MTDGDKNGSVQIKTRFDIVTSRISIIYLLIMLGLFGWLLFDTWIGRFTPARLLGYSTELLEEPLFKLSAYTVLGGGLGGILDGLRSFLRWFAIFDSRFVWKYISVPWMGATLALFVFALLQSGVSVLAGSPAGADGSVELTQMLAMFGIGALAGYGSRDVFTWLDQQVSEIFAVDAEPIMIEVEDENDAAGARSDFEEAAAALTDMAGAAAGLSTAVVDEVDEVVDTAREALGENTVELERVPDTGDNDPEDFDEVDDEDGPPGAPVG